MIHFGLAVEVVRRLPPTGSLPSPQPLPAGFTFTPGLFAFPELSHLPQPTDGLTLRLDGTPVAVAGWSFHNRRARIRPMYAMASIRGRGLGSSLLAAALHRIAEQGATEAFYDVSWFNEASRATAYRCGFRDRRALLVMKVVGFDVGRRLNALTARILQLPSRTCEE